MKRGIITGILIFLLTFTLIYFFVLIPLTCNFGKDVLCYAEKGGMDLKKCYSENQDEMWDCIKLIAKKTDDFSACELSNERGYEYTRICYNLFALEKKNPLLCFDLSCKKHYAQEHYKEYACEDLEGEDYNECSSGLKDALLETEDPTICDNQPKENLSAGMGLTGKDIMKKLPHFTSEQCYSDYFDILIKKDPDSLNNPACLKLPEPHKEDCLKEIEQSYYMELINNRLSGSFDNLNYSLCQEFPEPYNQSCIYEVDRIIN